MNKSITLSWMDKLAVLGLILTATGISVQILTNVVTATIPVGVIVMLTLALLIAVRIWEWTTTVAGVAASIIFIIAVFIAPGLFDRLSNPANFGPFIGTFLQVLGLVVTIVASAMATTKRLGSGSGPIRSGQTDRL